MHRYQQLSANARGRRGILLVVMVSILLIVLVGVLLVILVSILLVVLISILLLILLIYLLDFLFDFVGDEFSTTFINVLNHATRMADDQSFSMADEGNKSAQNSYEEIIVVEIFHLNATDFGIGEVKFYAIGGFADDVVFLEAEVVVGLHLGDEPTDQCED